jgi:hypothetical protein
MDIRFLVLLATASLFAGCSVGLKGAKSSAKEKPVATETPSQSVAKPVVKEPLQKRLNARPSFIRVGDAWVCDEFVAMDGDSRDLDNRDKSYSLSQAPLGHERHKRHLLVWSLKHNPSWSHKSVFLSAAGEFKADVLNYIYDTNLNILLGPVKWPDGWQHWKTIGEESFKWGYWTMSDITGIPNTVVFVYNTKHPTLHIEIYELNATQTEVKQVYAPLKAFEAELFRQIVKKLNGRRNLKLLRDQLHVEARMVDSPTQGSIRFHVELTGQPWILAEATASATFDVTKSRGKFSYTYTDLEVGVRTADASPPPYSPAFDAIEEPRRQQLLAAGQVESFAVEQ